MEETDLYKQRDRIIGSLAKLEPGTEKYDAMVDSLGLINTEIMSMEENDRRQTGLNHQMEMEEESLRVDREQAAAEVKTGKWDVALRFGGTVLAGVISGLFALAGIRETVKMEETDIPSRNAFGIARGILPKGK